MTTTQHAAPSGQRASGERSAHVSTLPAFGFLAFDGPDAASFLQGQFSNDVQALGVGQCHWTSYNSPKGRMLASMLLARAGTDAFRAFVAADLSEGLRRRLSMYVLRAKVVVSDLSATGSRYGLSGPGACAAAAAALGHEIAPGHVIASDDYTLAGLPDGRVVLHAPAAHADAVRQRLEAQASPAPASAWELAGIAAGVPHITLPTQDRFVPQTANWDLVGGLNFQKGCYPGQEIVARSQYLGKLKRRTALATIDNPAARAGDEVFAVSDPEQPCGMIVNVAPNGEGGADALVEMKLAALQDDVRLGSSAGAAVRFLDMPYALDALDL
jgi:folate-binding protein YgfZ